MGKLQEFLNSNSVEGITKDVIVSDRIKDENGEPMPFKIKPVSYKRFEEIKRLNTAYNKDGRALIDNGGFNSKIVIENTIEPNFKDSRSIELMGAVTPEGYLEKTLLSGEINRLAGEIIRLSGFNNSLSDLVQQSKN